MPLGIQINGAIYTQSSLKCQFVFTYSNCKVKMGPNIKRYMNMYNVIV